MIVADIITEAAVTTYGRSKGKVTRKYRCTSGTRKGRIVAKAATCNAPTNIKSKLTMKKTRARKSPIIGIKTKFQKRMGAQSKRIARLNKTRMKPTRRSTAKRRRMK
jgi:hypothetical protein|tara:strand:- start:12 stop:332 length:321 start_codon:yes stop_codon:yes gene_type:complete